MTHIKIYIEGGGDSKEGKAALRQGFEALLAPQKEAARARNIKLKPVLCGGRDAAFKAFQHGRDDAANDLVVLLVDSEAPVTAATAITHLTQRDRWDMSHIAAEHVHLMIQCMEAWIVADPKTLANFYGQGFRGASLPKRQNLEEEPKADIYAALEAATKETQKGPYGKIKHASAILKLLQPAVLSRRCKSFREFTTWLDAAIARPAGPG